jgi:Phage integrase, N-terminal SAM-like domain
VPQLCDLICRGKSRLLILAPSQELLPAPLFAPTRKAAKRVEFFTTQINNAHTRRAYVNATRRFADWCASKDLHELAQVQPFHVAAFIHDLQDELSPPSVKQHLAAIRMLFDWLVTGHVIETNSAHSVRGPRYRAKKGKTPVLTPEEAHALIESIPITKRRANDTEAAAQPDLLGLRDSALIAMMVYSFARIGAVIQMKVGDYFVQGRRRWVVYTRKAARSTTFRVTIASISACMIISKRPASPMTSTAISSALPAASRPAYNQSPLPAGRPPHHPPARESGRHRDAHRQSYLPRDRHHGVSEEQRQTRSGAANR